MVLMDLLWSDPTTNDGVEGVQPSPEAPAWSPLALTESRNSAR